MVQVFPCPLRLQLETDLDIFMMRCRKGAPRQFDAPNPLGFLIHKDGANTITEAAYRFVRHEPGVDVVLFGTGDRDHLRANIASLLAPPLPLADRQTLTKLFGHLVGVGLDPPYSMPGISSP